MAFNTKKNTNNYNMLVQSPAEIEINKQFDLLTLEYIDLQRDYDYLKQNKINLPFSWHLKSARNKIKLLKLIVRLKFKEVEHLFF